MQRRAFLRFLGIGLGATWLQHRFPWAAEVHGALPEISFALLADAHLQDGNPNRPEALALARAVTEIRALQPPPALVFLAGDLTHRGHPQALALGREILSELPAPLLAVMGEADSLPHTTNPWRRLFGPPWFSYTFQGLQVLGLHTAWFPDPGRPFFHLGEVQLRWLASELSRLNPAQALIVLSHAPLLHLYRPWQHWTADAHRLAPLFDHFRQVLCLHGHVHQAGASLQGLGSASQGFVDVETTNPWHNHFSFLTPNPKPKNQNRLIHLALPATSWPLPQPLQGTPAHMCPGLPPSGCGWLLMVWQRGNLKVQPRLWSV